MRVNVLTATTNILNFEFRGPSNSDSVFIQSSWSSVVYKLRHTSYLESTQKLGHCQCHCVSQLNDTSYLLSVSAPVAAVYRNSHSNEYVVSSSNATCPMVRITA